MFFCGIFLSAMPFGIINAVYFYDVHSFQKLHRFACHSIITNDS